MNAALLEQMKPFIDAVDAGGPDELGREYQQENKWPALAIAPIHTHRDVEIEDAINWSTLLDTLPNPKHFGITHVRSWGHGWHEQCYFNPRHTPTARAVLKIWKAVREDGCADIAELARQEIAELIDWIEGLWLPEGISPLNIALALRQRDDWEGNDSYSDALAYEEVKEIGHAFDEGLPGECTPGECICGLPEDDRTHRDPLSLEQIPGQLVLF